MTRKLGSCVHEKREIEKIKILPTSLNQPKTQSPKSRVQTSKVLLGVELSISKTNLLAEVDLISEGR